MKTDLCFNCAHYYGNNKDTKKDGYRGNSFACRAYPEEIPYNYPKDGHINVQDNQTGDFVFVKCTTELLRIAETDMVLGNKRFKERQKESTA